jgi:hypothetical protein
MAGRMNVGHDASPNGPAWKPRLMKAYAEGRAVRKAGGADTDNPEDNLGTPLEAAWNRGFNGGLTAGFKFETTV